jgi:hypothetical protein
MILNALHDIPPKVSGPWEVLAAAETRRNWFTTSFTWAETMAQMRQAAIAGDHNKYTVNVTFLQRRPHGFALLPAGVLPGAHNARRAS